MNGRDLFVRQVLNQFVDYFVNSLHWPENGLINKKKYLMLVKKCKKTNLNLFYHLAKTGKK